MLNDPRIAEIRQLLPQAMLPDWVRLGGRMVRLLKDRLHPAAHDAVLERLLAQTRASVALRERRAALVPQPSYPPELPVSLRREEIVAAIRSHQVVIIAGETGSGKTTQIPKMCLEAGLGIQAKIGCTQPRRVAALSIARRLAEELNVTPGREVGCKIRFDDRSGDETYIKVMTDGILLAETQGDPLLAEYNALIIDEAHERSLNIDFLLGYLKTLLAKRSDLKLIITSATIDTATFSQAFNNAPVIEVSGRMFPVEVIYAPFDADAEERGDLTYIDAAVSATERIFAESIAGDVLIFMPGERDIRETSDLLEGRFGRDAEVVPLFGRLSAGEQQRVFAPSGRRKLVIATNIAETSLTIPGIRYVIDTGLARISRYSARTRTRRLPVEEIAQSNANQRKGRCGRVENGVCIRLYSEENFLARPAHQQPEIQRANLAEVILRMNAFGLGEMETFPFLNPPTPAAVAGGYSLLQELGALDELRRLTPLGRDLARLPIDPTLGRMLLQSQREHCTREMLIIAAGLSIQDPRERPLDQKEAAAAAHQRFTQPRSDFLTLLAIWNGVHEEWERQRSQNARRKFCRAHFLSYQRLREWQDLYAQLHDALGQVKDFELNESNADYDAIHRAILSGLLGQVGVRKERNVYQTSGNRLVNLFPGSGLYDRGERHPKKPRPGEAPAKPAISRQPQWLMAGEIVETSQLFARMAAGIDPDWIVKLAPHLCKVSHQNPRWVVTMGSVMVDERITLHGLEVALRRVAYGPINPAEATELFIRQALVEEELLPSARRPKEDTDPDEDRDDTRVRRSVEPKPAPLPPQYAFLEHNRRVRQKIETWQTRVRRHDLTNVDDAMAAFYARQLVNVTSVHELNRFLRGEGNPSRLLVTEADLTGGEGALHYDERAFPNAVDLGGQPVELSYAYAPGEEADGVTVRLGFSLAQTVSPAMLEWSVPGLREGLATELLRSLPKSLRKALMPFPPKVEEIVRDFSPVGDSLPLALGRFIRERFGVEIPPEAWPADAVPAHLRPRVEVLGPDQKVLGTGRDLQAVRQKWKEEKPKVAPPGEDREWKRLALQWERPDLTGWTFGDLPERIIVSDAPPVPRYAWPGLVLEEDRVHLRLFASLAEARAASLPGLQRLVSLAVQKDLAWLHKDLRALKLHEPLLAGFTNLDALTEQAFEHLHRFVLPAEVFPALTQAHFDAAVALARARLPGLAVRFVDQLGMILKQRQEVARRCGAGPKPAPKPEAGKSLRSLADLLPAALVTPAANASANLWSAELAALLPPDFLAITPYERLPHLPRYLKALSIRIERGTLNPAKDRERQQQVAPYVEIVRSFASKPAPTPEIAQARVRFRWMVEEFKVSLFAQELGTAEPISAKRLDEQRRLL